MSSGPPLNLVRRDLFDARFQLISESSGEDTTLSDVIDQRLAANVSALEFIDAPSDLISGVYEGGLKTWECSLDLVSYLDRLGDSFPDEHLRGKRVLEVGCGTAVPSLYLLHRLFSTQDPIKEMTEVHLQDYNNSVLELVSLPNILLTWYMSASAAPFHEAQQTSTNVEDNHSSLIPPTPSEILITPELKSAFLSSLHKQKVTLRFFSGSWDSFDVFATGGKYDLVLTSETIYHNNSIPSLIKLLRMACGFTEVPISPLASPSPPTVRTSPLCLVAAKIMYFGVGGGVLEFCNEVEGSRDSSEPEGEVETVWELKAGVGRQILRVRWK